jgi:hypothetical protein
MEPTESTQFPRIRLHGERDRAITTEGAAMKLTDEQRGTALSEIDEYHRKLTEQAIAIWMRDADQPMSEDERERLLEGLEKIKEIGQA